MDAVEQSLGKPAQTLVVVGDVAKRSDVDAAVAAGVARFKSIDVWVNNAGQGISKKTELLTDDDFDSMMTINCKSVLYVRTAPFPPSLRLLADLSPNHAHITIHSLFVSLTCPCRRCRRR